MSASLDLSEHHVQLGYIAGAHGVGGALKLKLYNPATDALAAGVQVLLCPREGGPPRAFALDRGVPKPGTDVVRVWLVGVESREAADQLRGHQVWIDRADLPALDDDEFYLADLIGREVVRRCEDGSFESLGEITGVTSNTAQDLFEVRLRGREWLLPGFAPFLVEIEAHRVIVDVHDDLLPDAPAPGDPREA